MYALSHALREQITTRLHALDRHAIECRPSVRAAAVAIAITCDRDRAAFLLTARAAGLRAHARQYALPGGRVDGGEDPIGVLREPPCEGIIHFDATKNFGDGEARPPDMVEA